MSSACLRDSVVDFGILKGQTDILAARNRRVWNYYRNLMALTGVPTMTLVWVIKRSYSAPMKRRPAP